jgi:hypothetical protein
MGMGYKLTLTRLYDGALWQAEFLMLTFRRLPDPHPVCASWLLLSQFSVQQQDRYGCNPRSKSLGCSSSKFGRHNRPDTQA